MEKSKQRNNRFLSNQDFCVNSIAILHALATSLIEVDSYFVPDEDRSNFQFSKRELLANIEESIGKIRYMSNYQKLIDDGE